MGPTEAPGWEGAPKGWSVPGVVGWGFKKATELVPPRVKAAQEQIQVPIHMPVSLAVQLTVGKLLNPSELWFLSTKFGRLYLPGPPRRLTSLQEALSPRGMALGAGVGMGVGGYGRERL